MSEPFVNSVNGRDQTAIEGDSEIGWGVFGKANQGSGVVGTSQTWIGVYGESAAYHGVEGVSTSDGQPGVVGVGKGKAGMGVYGEGPQGPGVVGVSKTWHGVYGETQSTDGGAAVWGEHKANGWGVVGKSGGGVGVWGTSDSHEGVHAETHSPGTAAIAAYNLNPAGTGAAVFARKEGSQGHAGFFIGNVWIGGELGVEKDIILANADCAEDFDIAEADLIGPGTVMVVAEEGALRQSQEPYDKRVAGVMSGAGDYKPGIVLDKQKLQPNRKPVALLGKVYCKVDASHAPVEVGDLLTTSDRPGYAMKAADPLKAFGSVIGKALRPLKEGQGLIPILIALQ
jgi:hypothetical protein